MAMILKAKPLIKQIYDQIKAEVAELEKPPYLKVILAGSDPAAEWYMSNLSKKGKKLGMQIEIVNLPESIAQESLTDLILKSNQDKKVDGIMLQKPLPKHINETKINSLIDPDKDVDGFHPLNLGKLLLDQPALIPCTPQAVIEILKFYQISVSGKHVVILGRSNIVGKPLSLLLMRKSEFGNATVTVCHSKTENLIEECKRADILVAAMGRANFVKSEMIKDNAVIIDVGTNLIHDPEKGDVYVGDVEFDSVSLRVSAITPVPGGVGSVTTGLLLSNLVQAAKLNLIK